jgi:hypothetical protein
MRPMRVVVIRRRSTPSNGEQVVVELELEDGRDVLGRRSGREYDAECPHGLHENARDGDTVYSWRPKCIRVQIRSASMSSTCSSTGSSAMMRIA